MGRNPPKNEAKKGPKLPREAQNGPESEPRAILEDDLQDGWIDEEDGEVEFTLAAGLG